MDGNETNVSTTATTGTTENGTSTPANNGAAANTAANENTAQTTPAAAQTENNRLEDLVRREVDRATNRLGNENKKLRGQLDDLRKAKLSDDELKQLELQDKEKEISEREARITQRENELFAIKAIKDAGLDDGSNMALELAKLVMADDQETITGRVKLFGDLLKQRVQAEVDKTFKTNGRTPGVGTSATTGTESKNDSIAVRFGKETASANQRAQSTLEYYLGGKKVMKFTTNDVTVRKEILHNDHYVAMPYDCSKLTANSDGIVPAGTIVPANDATAIGVLLYDVKKADNPNGAVVIHGFINKAKLPAAPAATVDIPMVKFI